MDIIQIMLFGASNVLISANIVNEGEIRQYRTC